MGSSLKGLAEHVGVSSGYMTQVCRGRVSVTHVVDDRGYSVMLTKPEPEGA